MGQHYSRSRFLLRASRAQGNQRKKLCRSSVLLAALIISSLAAPLRGAEPDNATYPELTIAGPVLIVSDLERSLRFYTQGLGFVVASRLPGNPGPGATLVAPRSGRTPFLLLRQGHATPNSAEVIQIGTGLSRIMLGVSDAKALEARLRSANYEPKTTTSGNIFFVNDPDGYSYEIIQTRRAR
jgi:catechol 2,3-dioxygenase-like lactoylglutathione lyase family enzyme